MGYVDVKNIVVLDNPAPFLAPFRFEITFDCTGTLNDDLEWKVIYVGSAESSQNDQVLDAIFVGPVPLGVNRFVFQCDAPDASKIPREDVIGVTAVLITCSYMNVEFVRVGYYVHVDYADEQMKENPPATLVPESLARNILADRPRVTRFPIDWDNPQVDPERKQFEQENELAGPSDDQVLEEGAEEEEDEEDEDDEDEDAEAAMDVELGADDPVTGRSAVA